MARHRSRRHRTRSRKMRGGSYTDGSSFGVSVNGTGGSQLARTMETSGPYGQVQGNVIIGTGGQNVMQSTRMPTTDNLNLIQNGAGRRRRRGGFLGEVINQAIVPAALLGMQQTYRRKRRGGRRTRRHR